MRGRLRTIDEYSGSGRVRLLNDELDRVDRAQRVREIVYSDDLCFRREQLFEHCELQFARIIHRNHAQLSAFFLAEHLPGHDVGVML